MRHGMEINPRWDRVVSLFLFACYLLASPTIDWWARPENPWYVPYLLWAAIIALTFLVQRPFRADDL